MQKTLNNRFYLAASVALSTFLVYLPALRNGFVNWDDNLYIFENPYIRSLDLEFLRWSSLGFHVSNWHPLTWVSHAMDYAIWGLNPVGHHLTSIILHAINTAIVVLLALKLIEVAKERTTPSSQFLSDRTALIAAGVTGLLFGIHPVHVESVAWVAERKDLLCGLFFLLSIMMYAKYASSRESEVGSWELGVGSRGLAHARLRNFFADRHFLLTLGFFILALMSKPMAVSLPVVLLILDWYPFQRIHSFQTLLTAGAEKIMFFALSLASSIVTILAQRAEGSIKPMEMIPLSIRLPVAAKSLVMYLEKMLVPMNLIPFYPYPKGVFCLSFEYALAVGLVVVITTICVILVNKQKLWLSSWGYYVVTLMPVLGIVQVGEQSMADRYAYLPSITIFFVIGFIAAWILEKLTANKRWLSFIKACSVAVAFFLILFLCFLTVEQIAVWRSSLGLWTYVIAKEPERVPIAYNNRGTLYDKLGQLEGAFADYNKAIALEPGYAAAYYNRGSLFEKIGKHDNALADFNQAISLNPYDPNSYYNRALVFEGIGQPTMAIADYDKAISLSPNDPDAYHKRGSALQKTGQIDRAIADYSESIRINPRDFWARERRGIAYTLTGQYDRALEDFNAAIELARTDPVSYFNRGMFYRRTGKNDLALADVRKSCDLGNEKACGMLGQLTPQENP